uniref:Homologous-pairing protein 2 homolog n=1 Tax=Spongospora subterranea TaxID=70186 RepID=A0A0H5R6B7_9EUKA|eukprot:CRZ09386.1 hypothetical protein [Spongospora subterranea]
MAKPASSSDDEGHESSSFAGSESNCGSDSGGDSSDFEEVSPAAKKPSKTAPARTGKKKSPAPPKKAPPAKTQKDNADGNIGAKRAPVSSEKTTAKKAKTTVLSDAKAVEAIKEYMLKTNRPYSHLNVFDNLHGAVKKVLVPKILNQLSDSGVLQQKDFGKVRIYLANQSNFDEVDQTEMDTIDDEIKVLTVTHTDSKSMLKSAQVDVAALKAKKSDAELHNENEALQRSLNEKKELLSSILGKDGDAPEPLISKEEFKLKKDMHRNYVKIWKQRRRSCNEMLDCILENCNMKKSELEDEIGVENDASVGVSLVTHDSFK